MTRIGISMGDPAGVGPELLLRALRDLDGEPALELIPLTAPSIMHEVSRRLSLPVSDDLRPISELPADAIRPGQYSPAAGRAQMACLEAGARALLSGEIDALVTGPLHKRAIQELGQVGPGQTEWLQERLGADHALMMLTGPRLKVLLLTTHVPIRRLAPLITRERVEAVLRLAHRELRRYFHPRGPRLALCALNPHGEEAGEPGREEAEILSPAVEGLKAEGLDIQGPLPADSLMAQAAEGRYDAVVACYHDQGLAPIKLLHPGRAVNVTLGLGHIRSSPDHGPAYDIAWKGQAKPDSLLAAIHMAEQMVLQERADA